MNRSVCRTINDSPFCTLQSRGLSAWLRQAIPTRARFLIAEAGRTMCCRKCSKVNQRPSTQFFELIMCVYRISPSFPTAPGTKRPCSIASCSPRSPPVSTNSRQPGDRCRTGRERKATIITRPSPRPPDQILLDAENDRVRGQVPPTAVASEGCGTFIGCAVEVHIAALGCAPLLAARAQRRLRTRQPPAHRQSDWRYRRRRPRPCSDRSTARARRSPRGNRHLVRDIGDTVGRT